MYTNVNPRKIVIVASVTINGARRPLAMINPLTAPIRVPAPSPSRTASQVSIPPAIIPAVTALDRARIEPTDRSIPPVKITNVIPKAINAFIET
ncbi:hypothetical protein D3C75_1242130 [compost metagenome]